LSEHVQALAAKVEGHFGERLTRLPSLPDEVAYEVAPANLVPVCVELRDTAALKFEMLMDLAGVDFLHYGHEEWQTANATRSGFSRGVDRAALRAATLRERRYAVVYQLLSITHNERLRLRVHCEAGEDPMVDSLTEVWAAANWFEREAFDLFGILFRGHPDLRRILTDYGFIGHPFRKDFPLIGNVEVRYDPQKQRVVYEPVSIEPRVLVPKVIRHDNRYAAALHEGAPAAPGGTK
jgi:NADH-quinone oxidoreductase subunit C